ncbi:uncharacterized protein BROUX77_004339 [Berkeleyomyces rouxiae]|uniref:uncharacterized protein n=1 Tax=Berkeleyomyces rouxiae TaxID=2035830 RepID=UPI003B79B022
MDFPPDHVLRLKKAVYGLRSTPKRQQELLGSHLSNLGLDPLNNDVDMFTNGHIWIEAHVHDMLVLFQERSHVEGTISRLAAELQLHVLGPTTPISDDNLIDQESELLSRSIHELYRRIVQSLLHISLFARLQDSPSNDYLSSSS